MVRPVNGLAFVASLVHSLAWPAGVVVVVATLRKPIGAALNRGIIRRLRAGPFEVEFDQELAQVREELRRSPELAEADRSALAGGEADDLARLAALSPGAAVAEAFARVEARLAEVLDSARVPHDKLGGWRLARLARDHGLISEETVSAVGGLAVLRNLTAHSPGDQISTERAREYLALADAVLYALRAKPGG
jgi:hypothetical protein